MGIVTIIIDDLTNKLTGLLGQKTDCADYASLRQALGEDKFDWEFQGSFPGYHSYWKHGISLTFRERFFRLRLELVAHGHLFRGRYEDTLPYGVNRKDRSADVIATMPVPPIAIESDEKLARIFKSENKSDHLYFEIGGFLYDFTFDADRVETISINLLQGEGNIFEYFPESEV